MKRKLSAKEYSLTLVIAVTILLIVCLSWEANQSLTPPIIKYIYHHPPLTGYTGLYSLNSSLMDQENISFLLNNAVCNDTDQPILVLYIVFSHSSHKELRDAHRRHTSGKVLQSLGSRRVFLLADGSQKLQQDYPTVPMPLVLRESDNYRDLVVASFIDHYRNLTYKHGTALLWAKKFCPQAHYILKMDDDIMVDVWGVRNLLRSGIVADNTGVIHSKANEIHLDHKGLWAAGLLQKGLRPYRRKSKWKVTLAEFPGYIYPNFLSGWAYIITQPAASAIMAVAKNYTPFWIDDVYMTGMLAVKAKVQHYALNHHYTLTIDSVTCCLEGNNAIISPSDMTKIAPICNFLVAPSGKNVTLLASWLDAAKNCHQGNICPKQQRTDCPPTRPRFGVGSVIPLS
ncbi:beta-1,3-galactosyltransferase 5-like [Palaemon carinicauda]|uniref:beta-1,3-galactosyltransferase 5-like n=1 Tax=Palaemon carinicauda TaxID=392227 RepID=UPI0035B65F75